MTITNLTGIPKQLSYRLKWREVTLQQWFTHVIRRLELSLLGEKDLESGYAETLIYSCGRSKSI